MEQYNNEIILSKKTYYIDKLNLHMFDFEWNFATQTK